MSDCHKRGHNRDFDHRHDAGEQLGEGSLADGHAGRVAVKHEPARHKAYRSQGRDVTNEKWDNYLELPSDDAGY